MTWDVIVGTAGSESLKDSTEGKGGYRLRTAGADPGGTSKVLFRGVFID